MSGSIAKPTLAFFGATGGCTNAALTLALNDGYQCSALARTPQKLTDMLLAKGVTKQTLEKYLRIVKGDVVDLSIVKETIQDQSACVDIIISGIGMVFGGGMDTHICEKATASILKSLKELEPVKKPFLVCISTTGISNGPRDVPLLMIPLYRVLLAKPHADKHNMENLMQQAAKEGTAISGFVILRPSLFTNGAGQGMAKIRVGDEQKPAIGYTISRNDVGEWIFEAIIKGDTAEWNGLTPSLTY